MNIAQLKESRFLKKEDCGSGILVTIKQLTQESVNKEGAPEELKYCLHFGELDKPLVLNSVNAQLISQIAKSDETDTWVGVKVVLYSDPSVAFGGKIVGGIRVRAPRGKAAQQQSAPAPVPAARPVPASVAEAEPDEADGEVPF